MRIADDIKRLPRRTGVYIFKNSAGKVIYVGKALDLRSRVSSYTRPATEKLARLASEAHGLDFIITDNEVEALMLENTLIKKHNPRYNVLLKDDKNYPYIKLTNEEYPRLDLVRRVLPDGAKYFGPYSSAQGVRGTITFLRKTFPMRMCNNMKKAPCMYASIGRCLGPCTGNVDKAEYDRNVRSATLFLQGKHKEVTERLREQMQSAARAMEFERASVLRDRLAALESLTRQRQEVVWQRHVDMDIIAAAADNGAACAEVMFVRGGALVGHDPFMLRSGAAESTAEIISGFVQQYYAHRADIPGEIVLSEMPENTGLLSEFLTARRGAKVLLTTPTRGPRKKLAGIAAKNAEQRLRDDLARDLANRTQAAALLSALEKRLDAKRPLRRIAGFDISTFQGTNTVGSAVSFSDGMPDKSAYRKFIIRGSGRDDFSSMREMASRYLRRAKAGDWPRPDLIIVDGGKGQLSAVEQGIVDAEFFEPMYVIGFAKESFISHVMGGKPIQFERDEPAVNMIRRVIDEAHRFAITFHRKRRGEAMLHD